MPALKRTAALMAGLAKAIGLKSLPADNSGGFQLTIGGAVDIFLYGGDDESILVVAPVAPLPKEPGFGTMLYLLRGNLFDSDVAPFQIAADDGGGLVFWGRVRIADVDGPALAGLLDRVAARVGEMRAELAG